MTDGLDSIGDSVPALIPKSKPSPALGKLTKQQAADIIARENFERQEYGFETLAFMPSQLTQCAFPHDDPGDVPSWSRSTPWLTVSLQPGYRTDRRTGQRVCIGYPSGTLPRLIMFYLMTEIEHKKNRGDLTPEQKRTISLGSSLGEFMRTLGLNPNNGSGKRSDKRRLRQQVEKLARVKMSFEQSRKDDAGYDFADMQLAEAGTFWWTLKENNAQAGLFESFIVLSEAFYRLVLRSMIPLDLAALRALKNSSLHLDLYAWCLYRSHTVSKGQKELQTVSWESFLLQSGATYKHLRQFKAKVLAELPTVLPYLKGIRVLTDKQGITVHATRKPLISPRHP